MDLTSPQVWDSFYTNHIMGERSLPAVLRPDNYGKRRFIKLLREVLPKDPEGRVLEVGCGSSEFLPFFALELGYALCGIDYSPAGAALARRNLELLGIPGQIVQGDFFDPQLLIGERFSAVVSFGVIEHSLTPERFIARKAELLRPGGIVLTQVPNLLGYAGQLLRLARRDVYDQHLPISAEHLHAMHIEAGLEPIFSARYFGTLDLWQLNPWIGWYRRFPRPFARLFPKLVTLANMTTGALFEHSRWAPESRLFSPNVIAAYRKPG